MKAERIVVIVTLLWVGVRSAHVISKRRTEFPMLKKMDEISRHLRELTTAMKEFDTELREAVDDSLNSCRLSLHADFCNALEFLKERDLSGYLSGPLSPGKRNGDSSANKYSRIVADLKKRIETMGSLNKLFSHAGNVIEREKRWLSCSVNLGFTCQTQEYNKFADYYDFVNSPQSPGKKRAADVGPSDVAA